MKRQILVALSAVALVVAMFGFGPSAAAQYNSATGQDGQNGADLIVRPVQPELRIAEEFNAGPTPDTIPADLTATGGTGGAGELAFTGAESTVLAYIGSAMIAVGATAFVGHRRLKHS